MEMRSLFIVYSAFFWHYLWFESHFIFQTIYILSSETEFQKFFFFVLETFSYCNSVGEIKIVLNVFDLCLKWMSALKRKKSHF